MKVLRCCVQLWFFNNIIMGIELINFQDLNFTETVVEVGVTQLSSCNNLLAEILSESDIMQINRYTPRFAVSTTDSRVVIPRGLLFDDTERTFLRIYARNIDGSICSSSQSQLTFYYFPFPHNIITSVGSTARIKLVDTLCEYPVMLWPKLFSSKRENCYCLLTENIVYSFSHCARSCGTDYDVTLNSSSNSVIFHDISRHIEPFFVHFVCDEFHCFQNSCFTVSIISMHQVVAKDPTTVTVPNNSMTNTSQENTKSIIALCIVLYLQFLCF